MSNASPSRESRPTAVPAGGRPARRKWLLPLLLGLAALIALLLLLSQCGGDDDDDAASPAGTPTAAATTSAPASDATSAPSAAAGASAGAADAGQSGGAAGTVTAGGTNLLGADDLSAHDGQQAVGRAAKVQSVPSDEGFWVGTSEQDRIWVQLTGTGGESDYKVKQNDDIDFTGTVTKAAEGFAGTVGVTDAEGAGQLTEQGHYVSVPASSVKLSS